MKFQSDLTRNAKAFSTSYSKAIKIGYHLLPFLFVLSLWVISWHLLRHSPERGTFGDMFGAVNALYSGLAFAGVIIAILLQRKELELQRDELMLNRKELKGQKRELEIQNLNWQQQRFEYSFFSLLNFQNDIVNSVNIILPNRKTLTGRSCFKFFYMELKKMWSGKDLDPPSNDYDFAIKVYLKFYAKYQCDLSNYFKHLFSVVDFVEFSSIQNKSFYMGLICNHISDFELILIFYHSLCPIHSPDNRKKIESFALFRNLDFGMLFSSSKHKEFYKLEAYNISM